MAQQALRLKLAVIGGGSAFTLCVLQGAVCHADRWRGSGVPLHVALFDTTPDRCARWVAYGRVLAGKLGLPLTVEACATRDDALRDADVVMLTAGFRDAETLAHRLPGEYGFHPQSIHDGPPAFAFAAKVWPFCRQLADDIARLAPASLTLVLPNPTDALAEAMELHADIACAGLCVEVEHLRDHLAYYFSLAPDSISLDHGGVNHDGWILRMQINGQDGYPLLHEGILALPQHPDFHPGCFGMVSVYQATGYLRSSAYHNWPLDTPPYQGPRRYEEFAYPGGDRLAAVDTAIAEGIPLDVPTDVHPERSVVKYLGTGRAISRVLLARAGVATEVVSLQVRNNGAVPNFPPDVMVEVPAIVQGARMVPLAVGELPEWLGGTTRLLAVQRRELARYLLNGDRDTLRQALLTLPTIRRIDVLSAFADEVHRIAASANSGGQKGES